MVTAKHVHNDSKALHELVNGVIKSNNKITINKLIADGAYEGNDIFRYLGDNGIQPCIKVRNNATKIRLKKGHILRNLSVLVQKTICKSESIVLDMMDKDRWIVETVFSCIKRMFGEYVYSIRLNNIIQKMKLKKASLYNKMIPFRQKGSKIKDFKNHTTKHPYNKKLHFIIMFLSFESIIKKNIN